MGWWHSGLMAYWVAPNQTQCNPQPPSERCPTNLHGLDQGDVSGFQSVEGGDSSLQSRNGFSKVTFTLILDGLGCSCCLVSHCLVSSNHLHNQSPDEDCSKHHLHSHLMKTAATPPTQSPDEDCSNTTYTVTWWRMQQTPPAQSITWWRLQQHHLHSQSPDEDCSNTTCTVSHLMKTAATPPAQSVTWWRLVKTLPTSPNFKLFSDSAWSNFELSCLCKIHNKNKQITANTHKKKPTTTATKSPSPQPTPSTEAAAVQVQLTSFLASTSTVSCSIFTISFSVSSEVLISSGCRSVSSCCMTETWEAAKSSFSSPTR